MVWQSIEMVRELAVRHLMTRMVLVAEYPPPKKNKNHKKNNKMTN